MQEYDKAIDCYKQAADYSNDLTASLYHLGIMYHKIGFLPEALDAFAKVVKHHPDDFTVMRNYFFFFAINLSKLTLQKPRIFL